MSVVHVHHAPPQHAFGVYAQRVALVDVVVQHGGEQVVGCADGVEIAGEVQVDVFHGDDLRVAAARRAAFDAEHGPERRLAHGNHGLLADAVERVGEPDGERGFAFACGRGIDGGYQYQLAALVRQPESIGGVDFGFVFAVLLQIVGRNAELGGDLGDGLQGGGLGDLNVGLHGDSL